MTDKSSNTPHETLLRNPLGVIGLSTDFQRAETGLSTDDVPSQYLSSRLAKLATKYDVNNGVIRRE